MKPIRTFLITFLCCYAASSFAQAPKTKPLDIGDKMPELVFDKVIGLNKKTVKIADFKDKLLILDFWATWCHWCIAAFPKNDSLQKEFGDKMQIMLVDCKGTGDTEAKVTAFYSKRLEQHKDFKLFTIYDDIILEELFPHQLIPHYIWIQDGVVKAITNSEEVTSANIEKVLTGEVIRFPKKDE